jgi:hypothetical protein
MEFSMYACSVRLAGRIYDTMEEFQGMIPGVTTTSPETERLGSDAIRIANADGEIDDFGREVRTGA